MLHLARRRSGRRRCRSRSCTSTPGTTSTRCSSSATATSSELGVRWSWPACRTTSTPAGRSRHGPAGHPQPAADAHAAPGHQPRDRFDAVFGGARRDEEKARAKERMFSFRDEFGQWDPKNQRPELWNLYNGRHHKGEHIRVFPLSNWTELDIWQYIGDEDDRAAVRSTSPTAGRSSCATACSWRHRAPGARTGRGGLRGHGALPHRR